MLFQSADLACERVSKMHRIQISAIRCKKHVRNQARWEWRGGGGDFHKETPPGSAGKVARLSPDELPASTHSDQCRKEIPQLPS